MKNLFAKRLKECRMTKGLTQKQFAEEIGYTRSHVNNWETRGTQPDYDTLIIIAKYFNETVDYMLGLDDIELWKYRFSLVRGMSMKSTKGCLEYTIICV